MKKTSIILGVMLCVGITQVSISHMSQAQPAPRSFNQILATTQQELTNGDYQTVEDDARGLMILARSPQEKGQALSLLGEAFYRRQAYDEAREQWNSALELSGTGDIEKTQALAHLGLARSYSAQGSYDKAIPHFKVAVDYFDQKKMKPFVATFSLALADAYYQTHQNGLASNQTERAITAGQGLPDLLLVAHIRHGQLSLELNRFAEGRTDFEQVLKLGETTDVGTDYLKFYAQNALGGLDSIKHLLTDDGKLKKGLRSVTYRPTEFDQNISQVIAGATDEAVADKDLR